MNRNLDERTKKLRRRSSFIFFIDVIIIVLLFLYITNYVLYNTSKIVDNVKLRFKYMPLKDNIGYAFNLTLQPQIDKNINLNNNGKVKFFIKKDKSNITLWEKWVMPQQLLKDNKIKEIKTEFNLKKDEILSFTTIYDNYENGFLKNGKYSFGVEINFNNNSVILKIPVKIEKNKKPF